VAGRDTHLLRAPVELPERKDIILCRCLLGVVVACEVAKAKEDVWEAVLRFLVM
jgi:hypothetical protein